MLPVRTGLFAAGVVLACGMAVGASPSTSTGDQLLAEAQRQYMVKQRMEVAIQRFRDIVADLRANELAQQGNGPELDRISNALASLSAENVPAAARFLEEACRRLETLSAADQEIRVVVKGLERMLDLLRKSDDLVAELTIIIDRQTRLNSDSKFWGALLLKSPREAQDRSAELSTAQSQLARQVVAFRDRLAKDRADEPQAQQAAMLEKAMGFMDDKRIDRDMDSAGGNIEGRKPIEAVRQQLTALANLKELRKLLQPESLATDIDTMKKLSEALKGILKDQTELRKDTEKTPAEKFAASASDIQNRERQLEHRLGDARTDTPASMNPATTGKLDDAQRNMKDAEDHAAEGQQKPTTDDQKQAEKKLKDAIDLLDQDIDAAEMKSKIENSTMPEDLAQAAEDLAKKQDDLRDKTNKAKPDQFDTLKSQEQNLRDVAKSLAQRAPVPQLDKAAGKMDQAAKNIDQAKQDSGQQSKPDSAPESKPDAGKQSKPDSSTQSKPDKGKESKPDKGSENQQNASQQEATQNQKQASDLLRQAAKDLQAAQAALDLAGQQQQMKNQTQQADSKNLPELAGGQGELQKKTEEVAGQMSDQAKGEMEKAQKAMGEAGDSLKDQQKGPAADKQQQAIDALTQAAKAQMGTQPGPPGTPAKPTPGDQPGMSPNPLALTLDPNELGSRSFGGTPVEGGLGTKGPAQAPRDGKPARNQLYQRYARELPAEYRELLSEYYEAISK